MFQKPGLLTPKRILIDKLWNQCKEDLLGLLAITIHSMQALLTCSQVLDEAHFLTGVMNKDC